MLRSGPGANGLFDGQAVVGAGTGFVVHTIIHDGHEHAAGCFQFAERLIGGQQVMAGRDGVGLSELHR